MFKKKSCYKKKKHVLIIQSVIGLYTDLTFLSKILERRAMYQVLNRIASSNLDEPFQFHFKRDHSTETVLIRVADSLRCAVDGNQATILILFDLLAAFDTRNLMHYPPSKA